MVDADQFVLLTDAELRRFRVPGRHIPDSIHGPSGPAVGAPLSHETLIRIAKQRSGVAPVDLVPQAVMQRERGPAPLAWRRWEQSAMRSLCAIAAERAREYVQQQNAIDAPFQQMAKQRFFGDAALAVGGAGDPASAASGVGCAAALTGLVTSKTMQTTACIGPREVVEIDVYGSRVRRLQKSVMNSAHILDADAHTADEWQRWRRTFVTLTYRAGVAWESGHIRSFTDCVRKWFKRHARGTRMRLVWVMEPTKAGRPHYHCMIWVRSKDLLPKPDRAGWWPYGMSQVLASKVAIQRPVAYMAKYASKTHAEDLMRLPKGARTHGVCGLKPEGRRVIRFWRAPLFVRDHFGGKADIRKVQGGYMDKLTGEFLASPWHVSVLPSGRVIAWRESPPLLELAA